MTPKVFLGDPTIDAEQTGHHSVPIRLSRGPVPPSMSEFHLQKSHMESQPRPGQNRRRKAVTISMAQTLNPKKGHFYQDMHYGRTDYTVNPNSKSSYFNQTGRYNLFITYLHTSQVLMRSHLQTLTTYHITEECRWPIIRQRE